MDTKKLIGRQGESAAAEYLKKKKYRIIGMNYACRYGEIDLIAETGTALSSWRSRAGRTRASPRRENS